MTRNTTFSFPRWLILLGLLTALGPLAIDMYLPAFPAIAQGLVTSPAMVERTLAGYLLGVGLAQLFYGPMADRFGRKPPLLLGLAIFIVASLFCAQADNIQDLTLWRIVQAFGGAAGMAIPRAVIRDRFETREAAKALSLLILIMGVMPILAPLIGGQILLFSDWRGIFYFMAGSGVLLGLFTIFTMRESLSADRVVPLHPGIIARNYAGLLRHREFMFYSLAGGLSSAGMFAYISGSPRVFIELFHVEPRHFGFYFGANAAALILFSQIGARLLNTYSPGTLLRTAQNLQALITVSGAALAAFDLMSLPMLMAILIGFMACQGLVNPNSAALALSQQGQRLGTASALMGAMQMLCGSLAGLAVSAWAQVSALPLTSVLAACAVLSWLFGRNARANTR
ncbi:Bcr/CflA family multidrug efflux MFS transporter [Alcaligenes sp. SDU_A2]|uniref:Bcr/CflA family multidrug efflux MFS transporter n=1 Tax=Alcaligenes sp. SDU_A2 TaxID=3136634 RepID=UPI002C498F2E|nr:Bcr/CflA family multidrug efflux MFS transporter [Alcaligenes sp.]HRL28554.1 Bcr/CflA family multidrug efflux MFS transporter [Alcaligenes sp.]